MVFKNYFLKFLCFILFVTLIVQTVFLGCCKENKETRIKIGVLETENFSSYKEYLKSQAMLSDISFEFVDLSEGDFDPFQNCYENIAQYITDNKIDMIVGVPEDYILSQNETLFMNLRDSVCLDNMLPSVIQHYNFDGFEEVRYVPHMFYCSRFLIVNEDLIKLLNYNMPKSFSNISKVISTAYEINDLIESSKVNEWKAISFGSPADEFLYDDIANILLEYGYPRTEAGKQRRFYDDAYIEKYEDIFCCANDASYTRNEIGYTYPLDYYFATGNVAMKIASLSELKLFNGENSHDAPFNPTINDFEFSVCEFSKIMNTQSTVIAISHNTKFVDECLRILNFFMSEKYAVDILNGSSPFLIDYCCLPCISTPKVNNLVFEIYGISDLKNYTDYTQFKFVKNSILHWEIIQKEQSVLQDEHIKSIKRRIDIFNK